MQGPGQTTRRFGATSAQGVDGQPRASGSAAAGQRSFGRAAGERGFGSASPEPSGERHFGSFGSGQRSFGERAGFADREEPRRSESGRSFLYRGHSYQRFTAARYHYPRGFAYRRYFVGGRLPRVYLIRDYYLNNYSAYDLAPPPDDFEWIRYGPDVLLVDLDTGEIAQVIYGVFDESGSPDGYADAPTAQSY